MKGQYWAILLLSVVMLSGCAGRALTVNESAFLGTVHKLGVDYKKVKIHKSLAGSEAKLDKMFGGEKSVMVNGQALGREEVDRIVAGMPEAFVLYNDIYYQKDSYSNDFIPEWPDYVRIDDAALLAHEVTHVWQHQHKDLTGYSPLKALLEPGVFDKLVERTTVLCEGAMTTPMHINLKMGNGSCSTGMSSRGKWFRTLSG